MPPWTGDAIVVHHVAVRKVIGVNIVLAGKQIHLEGIDIRAQRAKKDVDAMSCDYLLDVAGAQRSG